MHLKCKAKLQILPGLREIHIHTIKAQGSLKYKGSEEEGRKVADEYLLGNYISDNIMSFSKPLFKKKNIIPPTDALPHYRK